MSIKNLEIKPSEAKSVEIASLPTRPTSSATYGGRGLTAQEMKKAYDAYPALIKERFNALIADLLSGIAINDIPFTVPSHDPFGENIEQTVKGFLDAVGSILDFGTDDARTIFGFVKSFVSDVAKATSLEYDKSTQLLTLTIDGEEKSVTIDFNQFAQFEAEIAELRSTIQTLDDTKFDKSGGGITGDVNIGGSVYIGKDLTVAGNYTIQEIGHLQVKDAVIVMNKDGEKLAVLAGSVIRKGENADGVDETYGIMYDPVSDSVKLGLVYQDESGNYQFLAGEGYPVATRADSSVMQDGMFAVWDAANRRFVTSDVNPSIVNGLTARVGSAEGNISTLLTDVQILYGSKLDEVDAYSIIYATDGQGNQTTLTVGEGLSVENGALKATVEGGTEVVANPTGSATAELSKLQVGSSVYSIPKSVPYTLPVASATVLGGVKPATKTSGMTQAVGVDSNGALYTTPTDLSAYYTGAQTDQKISAAVGAIQTNTFTVTENADGTVDLTIE